MRLKVFSIILIALIAYSINCFSTQQVNITDITSTVNNQESAWKADVLNIGQNTNITGLHIIDENFIIGDSFEKTSSTLYKTTDTGVTWEKLSTISGYGVVDVYFFNSNDGILTAVNFDGTSDLSKRKQFIMKTEDGGLNWKIVYSASPDYASTYINFNKDGIGVITGHKYTSEYVPNGLNNFRGFILISQDKGLTWTDASDNLNRYLDTSIETRPETLNMVIFAKDKSMIGVSSSNKFYKSKDIGKSWAEIAEIRYNNPPMIIVSDFGELENGKLWATGGSMSIEGQLATVSVMKSKNQWDTYNLRDYYFSDVAFLSNNEVFAVGYKLPHIFDNKKKPRKGVVLFSEDSGKNWSTVYESEFSNQFAFQSIIKISNQKIIVTGNPVNLVVSKKPN